MFPFRGLTKAPRPKGLKPHLVVKIKAGWTFNPKQKIFVSRKGKKFSPTPHLPKGSELRFMTPELATSDPELLSGAERDLARFLQILFPQGTASKRFIMVIKEWECIEDVRLPPDISLPSPLG
jgi:hypothetical protein